ncbi:MAG: hypothetical protein QXR81_08115 [Candidatus Nezhaarchaeales archaeon]
MEYVEFLFFIGLNLVLLLLTLARKAVLASVIGVVLCLYLGLNFQDVVVQRFVEFNSTANPPVLEYVVKADPSLTLLSVTFMVVLHTIAIIKALRL